MEKTKRTIALSIAAAAIAASVSFGVNAATEAAVPKTSSITTEQRARLAAKLQLIDRIAASAEPDFRAINAPVEARQAMRERMYKLSLEQIKMVGVPSGAKAITEALDRVKKVDPKALGALSTDLVYVPFSPCRYIDTRFPTPNKIFGVRQYDTFKDGSAYGGSAACDPKTLAGTGDENDIAAYALNMTLVDTSEAGAPGFAAMRPAGATQEVSFVNWTVASAGFQLGDAAVVRSDQSSLENEIEIIASGAVHVIVDLSGVFMAPRATPIACLYPAVTWSAANGTGFNATASCPAGYALTGGGLDATSAATAGINLLQSSPVAGNAGWQCRGVNATGGAQNGSCTAICCQIPGR